MRILLIHQYFLEKETVGGSRWNEMVYLWSKQGHEVTVLSGMVHYITGKKSEKYKKKLFAKENYLPNVEVLRCHVSETYDINFLGRLWGYFSFVFYGLIGGIFKTKGKYDVILATSPPLFIGIIALVLKTIKRAKLIFEIRDLWPESAIDTGVLTNKSLIKLAYWFEKKIYEKSKLINTLTPAFREKLIKEKHVPSEKVIMIPNAADFSLDEELCDFDEHTLRSKMKWDGKFVITYVGVHGIANHLIQIVETAELLKKTNAYFVLIGEGTQKKMLKERVEELGLKNVEFIDAVPKKDVLKYIKASDMGTSVLKKADTFKTIYSNKTFDYMLCKKPILMAIDGVSRDLIENADAGIFVEPENPKDFADKFEYCIKNIDEIKKQGQNGYHYAKKYFDRSALANQYINKIKEL